MIEILNNVFYDPTLEWYKQDPILIQIALEVINNETPINASFEETPFGKSRILWGIWNKRTEKGLFEMRLDVDYLHPSENPAFASREIHDTVTIKKLSDA